jgi:hypothetical protein
MDIRSDKGVRITGPSIKFTGLSHQVSLADFGYAAPFDFIASKTFE